ncbi:MAG: hypothetical protein WBP34_18065 [Thermoanaerobaculia bacterium]
MSQPEQQSTPKLQRIKGRLHFIHHVLDEDGNLLEVLESMSGSVE